MSRNLATFRFCKKYRIFANQMYIFWIDICFRVWHGSPALFPHSRVLITVSRSRVQTIHWSSFRHIYSMSPCLYLCLHAACQCCMSMLHSHADCPCCMSMQSVHAACQYCMSMLHSHAACPCCMSMQSVHAAYQCYMSMLHSHAACPCCMAYAVRPCCFSWLLVHHTRTCPFCHPVLHINAAHPICIPAVFHAACPCVIPMLYICPCCMNMLHVHAACTCCMNMKMNRKTSIEICLLKKMNILLTFAEVNKPSYCYSYGTVLSTRDCKYI
jgi:hypothetical protein